ncbi:hypothetical protein ABXV18_24885 [Vibrio owensii]|uniref:Gp49 family protein n=1 Tax=Vibrio owensii TaxID=696485 RepID=UPI003398DBEA
MRKHYTKLKIVEASEITKIEEVGGSYVATLEGGEQKVLPTELVCAYIPEAGDYYVVNDLGVPFIKNRGYFQDEYGEVDTLVQEPISDGYIEDQVNFGETSIHDNMTVTVLYLHSGFKNVGTSIALDGIDEPELGRAIAFQNACQELWEHESYLRAQEVYKIKKAAAEFRQESEDDSVPGE